MPDLNLTNDSSDANPAGGGPAASTVHVNTGIAFVDPNCASPGPLTIVKVQAAHSPPPGPSVTWGTSSPPPYGRVHYDITIKNTSTTQTISNIALTDSVVAGGGTPPFTRDFHSQSCTPAPACTGFTGAPLPATAPIGQHQYTAYWEQNNAWQSATGLNLAPGMNAHIHIAFRYHDPDCAAVPNANPETVFNVATITYQAVDPTTGLAANYTQDAVAQTDMLPQPVCPFVVTKTIVSGAPVQFGGPPLVYNVTFNNTGVARSIGTILDTVRLTDPAYATQVPFTATWNCAQSGGVLNYQTASSGSVGGNAAYTTSPAQGAQVMLQPSNIYFPTNSTLTCTVTIHVSRPAYNDPHCSAAPASLENLALMDNTTPYNPNVPWPPSGAYNVSSSSNPTSQNENWATIQAALPKCFDAIVNKTASVNGVMPIWTGPNGPAVDYTITATNTGSSTLNGSGSLLNWNGLEVVDQISSPYQLNQIALTQPCSPSVWCTPLLPTSSSTSYSPAAAGVAQLPPGQSGNWYVTLNPPFTANTTITNCASVAPAGTFTGPSWYSNYNPTNPPGSPQQACANVPVLPTAVISITKTVVNLTGSASSVPPNTTFNVSVANCTPWPLPVTVLPLTPNSPTQSVNPVPINDTCQLLETPPPVPVAAVAACNGSAAWDMPPVFSGANVTVSANGASIIIAAGTNQVSVTNTIRCVSPTGSLTVLKLVTGQPPNQANPATQFPITVQCGTAQYGFSLTANGSNTISGIPYGTNCSVVEWPLPQPFSTSASATQCPNAGPFVWQPPTFAPGNSVQISAPSQSVTVNNSYACQTATGSLTLIKTADYDGNILATYGPVTFPIQVNCSPNGPSTTVNINVNANGSFSQTVSNIPGGSVCAIAELPPVYPSATQSTWATICPWRTSYPFTQQIAIGYATQTLQVVNEEMCGHAPSTGSAQAVIQIEKTPIISGVVSYLPGVGFSMQETCINPTTGGYVLDVFGNPIHNYPWTAITTSTFGSSLPVPIGSACTFSESPPPLPQGSNPSCYWQTNYYYDGALVNAVNPPPGTVPITVGAPPPGNQFNWLNIQNQLICPGGPIVTVPPVAIRDPTEWWITERSL